MFFKRLLRIKNNEKKVFILTFSLFFMLFILSALSQNLAIMGGFIVATMILPPSIGYLYLPSLRKLPITPFLVIIMGLLVYLVLDIFLSFMFYAVGDIFARFNL
ncbi:hypothetical protein [Helicobacter apodemus]|uniref:hypothetical protein n=1 Tax=Helicobacter apodemus TaxID=135569 RepID=UPI0013A5450D|nr:hypothetical protein [Helicobacter apodemus]